MQVKTEWKPKIVAFCCNWCSYAGADLAGSARLTYPSEVKIIRIPSNGTASPIYDLYFVTAGKTWPNMTIYPIFKPEYLSDYTIEMQNNNFNYRNLSKRQNFRRLKIL